MSAKMIKLIVLFIALSVTNTFFAQTRVTSMRSVDFANFTYPLPTDLIDPGDPYKTFSLRNGKQPGTPDQLEIYLQPIIYSDVTGDGLEEAILRIGIVTGGSSIPGIVYIYTLQNDRAKPLWYFSTGDRADGGLHKVYADNSMLVVEIYGPQHGDGRGWATETFHADSLCLARESL